MLFREFLFVLLLIVFLASPKPAEISDIDWNKLIFVYPGKAESERDLQPCQEREVCSIVHKRYWFPRRVERYCYCEIGECPSTWSDDSDNRTMSLNNRAQLKFCEPVTQLPACNDSLYLFVENRTVEDSPQISSKAECHCPVHNRWVESLQLRSRSSPVKRGYRCSIFGKCKADEQCGWERTDYYEPYYWCSCPEGYLCVRRNNTEYDVNQMFYVGPAFKTICSKFSNTSIHLT